MWISQIDLARQRDKRQTMRHCFVFIENGGVKLPRLEPSKQHDLRQHLVRIHRITDQFDELGTMVEVSRQAEHEQRSVSLWVNAGIATAEAHALRCQRLIPRNFAPLGILKLRGESAPWVIG